MKAVSQYGVWRGVSHRASSSGAYDKSLIIVSAHQPIHIIFQDALTSNCDQSNALVVQIAIT